MTCRKALSLLKHFLPSNQIVNLQMLHHPYLKVFVNQLSQKQTLSIRSMYKLCLGKKIFLAMPLTTHLGFTAQVLKVCRTPGPTACFKVVTESIFEKVEKGEKSVTGPGQP